MSEFGWKGQEVRLVPLDEERHLERCLAWINDPEVTRWTLSGDFPASRPMQREWLLERSSKGGDRDVVFAIETQDGEHVGNTGIHAIDWRNRHATTGTMIGARERWGQGLGTDTIRTRSRYAFEVLGLRLLMTEVMEPNVGSLKALTKAGFDEAGRVPGKWWKRGAWHDSILMVQTVDDWRASRGA